MDSISWGEVFVWGFVCGVFGGVWVTCCVWLATS
jgi:hypothetical protein